MSVWTKHVPIVAWLLCVGLLSTSETRSWVRTKRHTPYMPVDHWQGAPEFGYTESNLTVAVNATAELKCPIGKVQDDAISFVRPNDNFNILSNGHALFTTDKRIQIVHLAKTIDWILRINNVKFEDAGKYECQVSIKSGVFSLPFILNVISPKARILGSSEFHLDRGSTISLTCVVTDGRHHQAQNSRYILWYHNARLISYDQDDDYQVTTEKVRDGNGQLTGVKSLLKVKMAGPSHAGNYTCQPSNAVPASIQVFVSEDRMSEPLLRPDASQPDPNSPTSFGTRVATLSGWSFLAWTMTIMVR